MHFSDHLTVLVSYLLGKPYLIMILLALGQLISFTILWRKGRNRLPARAALIVVFLGANLAWALTVKDVYLNLEPPNPNLLALIHRPAQSWQLLCFLIVACYSICLFLRAVAVTIARLLRLIRQRPKKKLAGQLKLNRERRDFLAQSGTALTLMGGMSLAGIFGGSGYGLYRQARRPEVLSTTLNYPDLPQSLDNFKIVQLTDLHLGLLTSLREVETAFELAAELKPDLAVVTGDWVDRKAAYAKLYSAPVSRLLQSAPWGVWGVLGNHDHYVDPIAITNHLRDLGVKLLNDQFENLSGLGLPLLIVGLNDPGRRTNWIGRRDYALNLGPFQPILQTSPDLFKLLLFHRPLGLDQAAHSGFHLFLAGHTHGGQYGLDQANLAAFSQQYTNGWYQKGLCRLNVSRGLASVGLPFRLGPWPSIDLITLKACS